MVQLPFSTLKYLRVVAARTSRSAKLENLLLLLLRCLIFALLALAAARPAVSTEGAPRARRQRAADGGAHPRRSMSMGYNTGDRTRLDAAKAQASPCWTASSPATRPPSSPRTTAAMALVAQPTLDRGVARRAIDGRAARPGGTDFAAALVAARKVLAASTKPREGGLPVHRQPGKRLAVRPGGRVQRRLEEGRRRTWSSCAPTTWRRSTRPWRGCKITTPLVTEGSRVSGAVDGARTIPPRRCTIWCRSAIGDATWRPRPVEVAPNGRDDVTFEFQMPVDGRRGRTARGVARLQGDNLPAGRPAFSSPCRIHQTPKVGVFEGQTAGPERVRCGYYLRRALAAGLEAAEPPALAAAALDDADARRLFRRVPGGRAAPERPGARSSSTISPRAAGRWSCFPATRRICRRWRGSDFLPATAVRLRDLPAGRLASQIVDPGNPLFANTWGPGTPFPPLPQRRLIEWKLKPGAQVLVLAGGTEAIRDRGRRRRGARVTSSTRRRTVRGGIFRLSPAFLPLVQQIALQSSERGPGSQGTRSASRSRPARCCRATSADRHAARRHDAAAVARAKDRTCSTALRRRGFTRWARRTTRR